MFRLTATYSPLLRLLESTIPALDHSRLPFPSQHTHASRPQRQQSSAPGSQPNPPRSQNPQNVRMSKQSHLPTVNRRFQGLRDHTIRALSHMFHRLPTNYLVLPNRPPRNLCLNLLRSLPFINAVVPLLQSIVDLSHIPKSRNRTCLPRPLHRTHIHCIKPRSFQTIP